MTKKTFLRKTEHGKYKRFIEKMKTESNPIYVSKVAFLKAIPKDRVGIFIDDFSDIDRINVYLS